MQSHRGSQGVMKTSIAQGAVLGEGLGLLIVPMQKVERTKKCTNSCLTLTKLSQKEEVSGLICAKIASNRALVQIHNFSDHCCGQCLEPTQQPHEFHALTM